MDSKFKRSKSVKRTWFMLIVVVLTSCFLANCAGPSGPSSASSTGGTTAQHKAPYTIGLSDFFEGNSWQAENVSLFQQACNAYGQQIIKKCIVANANGSTEQQIAQIHSMINAGVDAILLDANSDTGLNNVVAQAMSAGIPVINYDSIISGKATSKINTDQYQWGVITANWLVNQLHGKGNVIVLNGLAGNPTNNLRYQYAQQLFAKTPGIHVLTVAYDEWDQAKAEADVSQMLDAYPKIDAVWSQGGAMTAGAIDSFIKAGRPLVPMTGEDYNGYLKLWLKYLPGGFTSVSPGQPNYLTTLALDAAVRTLQGHTVPAVVNVPLPVITDQTASQYYQAGKSDSYWVLDHISKADEDKLLGS
jgi:ribose transport system substrate-binding protein